jgi:hypothetical protein
MKRVLAAIARALRAHAWQERGFLSAGYSVMALAIRGTRSADARAAGQQQRGLALMCTHARTVSCLMPGAPLPACPACAPSLMSDWNVELVEDNISEFYVDFGGPKDSEWWHAQLLCWWGVVCGATTAAAAAAACKRCGSCRPACS